MNTAEALGADRKLDAKARALMTAARRHKVSYCLVRNYSNKEIVDALTEDGLVNLLSGQPWDLRTVQSDVAWLKRSWEREHVDNITTWKYRLLNELTELKKEAWKASDRDQVRRLIETQAKILGIYEVEASEQPTHSGQIVRLPVRQSSPEEWLATYGQPGTVMPAKPPTPKPVEPIDITPIDVNPARPQVPWAGMAKLSR